MSKRDDLIEEYLDELRTFIEDDDSYDIDILKDLIHSMREHNEMGGTE